MQEYFGEQEKFTSRLCVSLDGLRELVSQLDKAGLTIAGFDIYLPHNRSVNLTALREFDSLPFNDLTEARRVFFSCEGVECAAQAGFTRDQIASYSFHSADRMRYHTLKGIFQDFELRHRNLTDDCPGHLATAVKTGFGSVLSAIRPVAVPTPSKSAPQPVTLPGAAKVNPRIGKIIAGLVASLTVVAAYLALVPNFSQSHSTARQADAADSQVKQESSALFTAVLPTTSPDEVVTIKAVRRDYVIQNVGRSPATNVHLRCGDEREHGPYADLGTIAPQASYTLHSLHTLQSLSGPRSDQLHDRDYLCENGSYLLYDDGTGHHVVLLDRAGNAKPVP